MRRLTLDKTNKLCSLIAIEALFSRQPGVESALVYPVRVVWRINQSRKADRETPKFFISVPKRRLRHAVDRVKIRRRIREAYRLNRLDMLDTAAGPLDIAFIYVADKLTPYHAIERAVTRCLTKIAGRKDGQPPCSAE